MLNAWALQDRERQLQICLTRTSLKMGTYPLLYLTIKGLNSSVAHSGKHACEDSLVDKWTLCRWIDRAGREPFASRCCLKSINRQSWVNRGKAVPSDLSSY